MDYSLRVVQGYGITQSIIETVSSQVGDFFDLVITSKLTDISTRTNRKAALKKVVEVLKNHREIINPNLVINPYILLAFDAPKNGLSELVDHSQLENITQIRNLSYTRASMIMQRGCRAMYGQLQQSVDNFDRYFITADKTLLVKDLILIHLFNKQQMNVEGANHEFLQFIKQLGLELKLSDTMIDVMVIELIEHDYIRSSQNKLFFPDNIFYQTELDDDEEKEPILTLAEWLQTDFKDREILRYRLKGLTLEEIGQIMGITRERVRQRQARVLKEMPTLKEMEQFHEFFETYDFSLEDFTSLFHVSESVYQFLNLVLRAGEQDPSEFVLHSELFSEKEKFNYAMTHKFMVTHFGDLTRITKSKIVEEVLYTHRRQSLDLSTLARVYQEETKKYPQVDLAIPSLRALEGIMSRSHLAIHTFGRQFRYFDYHFVQEDLADLRNLFAELEPGSYTMLKLFHDHQHLMAQLDIRDEYELHYLYRQEPQLLPTKVTIKRSPEFIVGDCVKKEFIKSVLVSFAHQNIDACLDYLYDVYGHKRNTMAAYISANFPMMVHDSHIYADEVQFDEHKLLAIKERLTRPVYLKSELQPLFNIYGREFSVPLLNQLGYWMQGNIIFKKVLHNANQALSSLVTVQDVYRRPEDVLNRSPEMSSFLLRMEQEHKLFMIDDDVYVSRSFLGHLGVQVTMINHFISAVNQYVTQHNELYFTLSELIQNGFDHPLLAYDFKPLFFERLLVSADEFRLINRKSPLLFVVSTSTLPVTLAQFLSDQLINYPDGVLLQKFLADLKAKFRISFVPDRVVEHLRRYGAFYAPIQKKLYFDEDQYLQERYS